MQIPVGYRETIVSPRASRNVEAYWSFTAEKDGETLVLPDGRCDIILRYNSYTADDPTPIITGPGTSAYSISYVAGDSWLGVRLQPINGVLLWQKHITSAANKALRGSDVAAFLPELAQANRSHTNFNYLKRILKPIVFSKTASYNDDWLSYAFDLIHSSGGRLGIEKLAVLVGFSPRHLNRAFRASVGLSVKIYCQIVQFHRTLNLIQIEGMPITVAAFEGGYADHAHLTRSFRRFSGLVPSKLPSDLSIPVLFE